eukprot:GHVN01093060.1.p1 GENE.GHVN01093060.1~~GHVN01093060.1.p1  ORF type:complete len:110 (-),score=9.09 GHVN01093060.1:306-635(-)
MQERNAARLMEEFGHNGGQEANFLRGCSRGPVPEELVRPEQVQDGGVDARCERFKGSLAGSGGTLFWDTVLTAAALSLHRRLHGLRGRDLGSGDDMSPCLDVPPPAVIL